MRSIFKSTLSVVFIAMGTMTFSQETVSEDLSLGEPVGPQVGQAYVSAEYGDWAMRCIKAAEGETDRCSLYQLLENDEGLAVAEFNLFRLPEAAEAAAGATIVVPLETLLTEQLTLAVDGANARRYPFTFCNSAGCLARVGFRDSEIEEFKRGNVATIRLIPAAAPDQEVILDVSLRGFTAAFDAMDAPE